MHILSKNVQTPLGLHIRLYTNTNRLKSRINMFVLFLKQTHIHTHVSMSVCVRTCMCMNKHIYIYSECMYAVQDVIPGTWSMPGIIKEFIQLFWNCMNPGSWPSAREICILFNATMEMIHVHVTMTILYPELEWHIQHNIRQFGFWKYFFDRIFKHSFFRVFIQV